MELEAFEYPSRWIIEGVINLKNYILEDYN